MKLERVSQKRHRSPFEPFSFKKTNFDPALEPDIRRNISMRISLRKRLLTCAAVSASLAFTPSVLAQEADTEDEVAVQETIIVTGALGAPRSVTDSPVPIDVFGADDFSVACAVARNSSANVSIVWTFVDGEFGSICILQVRGRYYVYLMTTLHTHFQTRP